jgi:glutamyl-tRNA reductase
MKNNLFCLKYSGVGRELLDLKEISKKMCTNLRSYVRISTCQRVEIYSEYPMKNFNHLDSLRYPDSLIHLVELMSGVQSGLFGEIEISKQIVSSIHNAEQNKHVSKSLLAEFKKALVISNYIREKYNLKSYWLEAISKKIKPKKMIYIFGDGELAKSLRLHLGEDRFVKEIIHADIILVLRRSSNIANHFSKKQKIINLTEEKISEDEITIEDFFKRPPKKLITQIKKDIQSLIF